MAYLRSQVESQNSTKVSNTMSKLFVKILKYCNYNIIVITNKYNIGDLRLLHVNVI